MHARVSSIVSVAEMRALEAAAFAAGVSEARLQENAGAAVTQAVLQQVAPSEAVVIVVGHGNNGRDGAVVARRLALRGLSVHAILAPRAALSDAEVARLRELKVIVHGWDDAAIALEHADLVVDAIAGIGATGQLRDPLADGVRAINRARKRVLALDVPSGVDADTGSASGDAVRADTTVTMGAVKRGLLRPPGVQLVGRLRAADIGIPHEAYAGLKFACLTEREVAAAVPPRPMGAHKYTFGRTLVVAGSDHFPGAAVLTASGAARAGAGLVTVSSTRSVRHTVAAHLPEATYTLDDLDAGIGPLRPYLASHSSLVVGPGLGRSDATGALVRDILQARAELDEPGASVVVDADALFALAEWPAWWDRIGPNAVLTPHAGELARLIGDEKLEGLPWEQAAQLAQRWRCVLIAKGPVTSVAHPDGRVEVWPRANPALATGGTGDVLAGVCAGLLAQRATAWDAARAAVAAHAIAAESIVERSGWRTLLASDLLPEIPAALFRLATLRL